MENISSLLETARHAIALADLESTNYLRLDRLVDALRAQQRALEILTEEAETNNRLWREHMELRSSKKDS